MKRILLKKLIKWKNQKTRKPLLLDGARQVGKSYLIEEIFAKSFPTSHKFDFLEQPELHHIFQSSLDPKEILKSLEVFSGRSINTETDLIFFDEIGECQKALSSLKYFCEKIPQLYLCSSGSNIGLLKSFPVGKITNLELSPMNFYEFLMASGNKILIQEFENQSFRITTHQKLWTVLLDYYFVGGMPEAVQSWFLDCNINEKIGNVTQVHKDLIIGYQRDFGKYGDKVNTLHIESIFTTIPQKLQETRNDSVKRFSFKNVIKRKTRYAELRGPIDWLIKTNLISKNYIITSPPSTPLSALTKENIFKLFFFDVGLLNHSLGLSYKEVISQNFINKGFVAENFVQCELKSIGLTPSYSWQENQAEIEFILANQKGDIFPIEVKSGSRTRAKSLTSYISKYVPKLSLKLIGSSGNVNPQGVHKVWPLYYAMYINKL